MENVELVYFILDVLLNNKDFGFFFLMIFFFDRYFILRFLQIIVMCCEYEICVKIEFNFFLCKQNMFVFFYGCGIYVGK